MVLFSTRLPRRGGKAECSILRLSIPPSYCSRDVTRYQFVLDHFD